MTRILIVDDHDIIREGLKQIVADARDISVAVEARTGNEAIELVRRGACDVVVLDLNLPDRPGLDVLTQMRSIAPAIPVLILSMHRELSYVSRAMRAGAAGYISKDSARTHLVSAIQRVAAGDRFLPPEFAESLAFDLMDHAGKRKHDQLSDREFQVLCMIAGGKPPREIAAELNVSVKTIGTNRARLLEKMRLKNNAELVQYAIEHNLLPEKL